MGEEMDILQVIPVQHYQQYSRSREEWVSKHGVSKVDPY